MISDSNSKAFHFHQHQQKKSFPTLESLILAGSTVSGPEEARSPDNDGHFPDGPSLKEIPPQENENSSCRTLRETILRAGSSRLSASHGPSSRASASCRTSSRSPGRLLLDSRWHGYSGPGTPQTLVKACLIACIAACIASIDSCMCISRKHSNNTAYQHL